MTNAPDQTILAWLQDATNRLQANPSDVPLRTEILKKQVEMTAKQLEITPKQAGTVVKTYTAAYAKSQSLDPQAVIDTLTKEEQAILDYSANAPKLYGVDLITANKIAGYLGIGSGVLLAASITAFTVALFTVGPEIAAGITAAEGVVGAMGTALGSPIIATGGFLFLLSQFLGHLSSGIPMMTKQMIDNGSIGPGLRITAIKQAEEEKAKLSGSASPGSFTAAQFSDYAASLEVYKITNINDPAKGEIVPYSRQNLADLVKYVYGKAAATGGKTTVSKLIPQLAPYLIFGKITAQGVQSVKVTTVTAPIVPQVHVFAGVVSSGVIGSTAVFTPRPDDLIENADELTHAAHNNLAPFIAAIGSRLAYTIKIVPSVKTASGFTQRGTAQQIISGYHKNGTPKYRTVVNKFAVMDIFVKTDKGSQAHITTIVLGPVDSIKFHAANVDMTSVATTVQQNIVAPASTHAPSTPQAPATVKEKMTRYGITLYKKENRIIYHERGTEALVAGMGEITDTTNIQSALGINISEIPNLPGQTQDELLKAGLNGAQTSKRNFTAVEFAKYLDQYVANEFPQAGAATASTPTPEAQKTPAQATNLFEYYKAHGQTLPSVEERSKIYEQLALGQAAYYTGTAEQNTKLLAALLGARL